jgi:hypothetical protein
MKILRFAVIIATMATALHADDDLVPMFSGPRDMSGLLSFHPNVPTDFDYEKASLRSACGRRLLQPFPMDTAEDARAYLQCVETRALTRAYMLRRPRDPLDGR